MDYEQEERGQEYGGATIPYEDPDSINISDNAKSILACWSTV
jgi:hypothetical protein